MSSSDGPTIDTEQFKENIVGMGAEGVSQLATAVTRDELTDDRERRLTRAIQELTDGERGTLVAEFKQDSSDIFTAFTELETALGLEATAPSQSSTQFIDVDDSEFTPESVRNEVMSLLGISGSRDIEYFEAMARAFRTGTEQPGAVISQNILDQIGDSDREEFAEIAEDRIDALRESQQEDDTSASTSSRDTGGDSGGQPDRGAPQSPDDLMRGDADIGGDTGGGDIEIREDWFKADGTTVPVDLDFVDRFTALVRDLGRARDLDINPDPMKYFELTPESQRRLYDVTPKEFIRRAVARNDVTPNALRNRGFSEDMIPDPDDINDPGPPRYGSGDDDDDDGPDDRFLGMV